MRRLLAAALLLVCLTGCLTACDDDADGWTRGADAPFAARWGAISGWTGQEVLVVGGVTSIPYPPGAGGGSGEEEIVSDGAAYDPGADSWRPIADAPRPIGYWFTSVVVDDTWLLYGRDDDGHHFLAYDIANDTWRELPKPPHAPKVAPVVLGGLVYVPSRDDRVMVLDVASGAWDFLPPSTEQPPIDIGGIVATDDELVVTGPVGDADVVTPEVWDGSAWRRLPETGQAGSFNWQWAGQHLVCMYLDTNGDGVPAGGRLDPATGVWDRIPGEPASGTGSVSVTGATGTLVVGWGWLYDDAKETWTAIPALDEPLDSPSSVLAGDRIVVVGGFDTSNGYVDEAGMSRQVSLLRLADVTPGG